MKPNKLEYYVDEDAYRQSKEPRGVVVIRPDLVIQPKVGDTRGFVMVLEGQELRLQAENDREAQEWMESIRVCHNLDSCSIHPSFKGPCINCP